MRARVVVFVGGLCHGVFKGRFPPSMTPGLLVWAKEGSGQRFLQRGTKLPPQEGLIRQNSASTGA